MSLHSRRIGIAVILSTLFLQTAQAVMYTYPSTYSPYVPTPSYGGYTSPEAIAYVNNNRIMTGYKNGGFGENNLVNRAEFAKIITVLYSRQVPVHYAAQLPFFDTSMNAWYTPSVVYAFGNGLMQGYPDGSFRPSAPVLFAEASKVLGLIYNFGSLSSNDTTHWYRNYVRGLADRNAIPTSILSVDQPLTRGQLADIIYRLDSNIRSLPSRAYTDFLNDNASTSSSSNCDNSNNLKVTTQADNTTPSMGDIVDFTLRVRNCTGEDQRIDLSATFDSDFQYVSASDSGYSNTSTRADWRDLRVNADGERSVELRLRVRANTGRRTLNLDVRATDQHGNSDSDSVSVDVNGSSSNSNGQCFDGHYYYDCNNNSSSNNTRDTNANILIDDVTADLDQVYPGDTVRYEVRLRNRSGNDNERGTLVVQFDPDFTFVSGSSNVHVVDSRSVRFDDVRLDRYTTTSYTIKLRVRDGVTDEKLLQTFFTVTDSNGNRDTVSRPVQTRNPTSSNNGNCYYDIYNRYTCPNNNGQVNVQIQADQNNPRIGDIVHYIITVNNNRSTDDYIDVQATLDSNLTYISSNNSAINSPNDTVKWTRQFIPRYGTSTFTLDVRIAGGARIGDQLRVDVTADGSSGRSENAAYVRVSN